jgi:uncharacterized membrane protein YGL010W
MMPVITLTSLLLLQESEETITKLKQQLEQALVRSVVVSLLLCILDKYLPSFVSARMASAVFVQIC